MTLILQGTDNSVSSPAVQGGTAGTTTGVYYPASNQIALAANGAQALLANSSQGVQIANTLGVGATTPSTSGAGITFPSSQSQSTNANTLDDYEEGTWTPVLSATGTAPTGVTYDIYRYGRYTKIGRIVHFRATVTITSKGTGGSGDVVIQGIPFTPSDYSGYAYSPFAMYYYPAGGISGTVTPTFYDQGVNIYLSTPGNATSNIQWSTISGTEKISIMGVYMTGD